METIKLREEFIKLGQALKACWSCRIRSRGKRSNSGWNGKGEWSYGNSSWKKIIWRRYRIL